MWTVLVFFFGTIFGATVVALLMAYALAGGFDSPRRPKRWMGRPK